MNYISKLVIKILKLKKLKIRLTDFWNHLAQSLIKILTSSFVFVLYNLMCVYTYFYRRHVFIYCYGVTKEVFFSYKWSRGF